MGPTKVLREKVHCRSLSSIHIDYNQPLVSGLSMNATPLTRIVNLQLDGEVAFEICDLCSMSARGGAWMEVGAGLYSTQITVTDHSTVL